MLDELKRRERLEAIVDLATVALELTYEAIALAERCSLNYERITRIAEVWATEDEEEDAA